MIEELAQGALATADRLMRLDALNSHFEWLVGPDGADVTEDPGIVPNAMIWIHDREEAVIVIAIERGLTAARFQAVVSIRPYSLDNFGKRVLSDPLPEHHPRCEAAGKVAGIALVIHLSERLCERLSERLGYPQSDAQPAPRRMDFTGTPPTGDLSLLLEAERIANGESPTRTRH